MPIHLLRSQSSRVSKCIISYRYFLLLLKELAKENNLCSQENPMEPIRNAESRSGVTCLDISSITYSRQQPWNANCEQSRSTSPESSISEQTKTSPSSSTTADYTNQLKLPFDEEKTQARVHSLIEEYTENYSDTIDRPVQVNLKTK